MDIAGPGFLNITLDAAAAGERAIGRGAGPRVGTGQTLAGTTINLELRLRQPTGPIAWAAPLGRRGELAGARAAGPGRGRGARVLLQRPRQPDRPLRPDVPAGPCPGRGHPEEGYGGQSSDIAQEVLALHPGRAGGGDRRRSSARRAWS
ncbi:hypothetical protein QJS66_00060 [Kocuria rhizophila]|nr:hypothetical protein QJS66_00060 [Kocuria rhizophila]